MDRVILSAEVCAKLNGLSKIVPLYDESGEVVGYAVSPAKLTQLLGIPVEEPFTEEELNAPIDLSDPGRPLEDILRDLREGR